jgi:hypothetical protein
MSSESRERLFMVGINAVMASAFGIVIGAVFLHEVVAGMSWWRTIGMSSLFHVSVYNTVRAAIGYERALEKKR